MRTNNKIFTALVGSKIIDKSNLFSTLNIFHKEYFFTSVDDNGIAFYLLDDSILCFKIPYVSTIRLGRETIFIKKDLYKKLQPLFAK